MASILLSYFEQKTNQNKNLLFNFNKIKFRNSKVICLNQCDQPSHYCFLVKHPNNLIFELIPYQMYVPRSPQFKNSLTQLLRLGFRVTKHFFINFFWDYNTFQVFKRL
jgi:hypothetical protein